MLSISNMSLGQEHYYLDLATEDYYLDGGEPPGRWLGKAAAALGLTGPVERTAFSNLFAGRSPDGSRSLVQLQTYSDGRQRQPGWDLTFSAPKPVTVIWSQASDSIGPVVEDCHYEAVKFAFGYLEDVAAFSRRGQGGTNLERCGLVAAIFEHGTSRSQDPQLHSHVLLVNLGARADGTFGTLRSRDIYLHKMAAGVLYRTELARQLSERLGLTLVRDGFAFDVDGVPSSLCDAFSQRRADIEEALAQGGLAGPRASEYIARTTRDVKGHVAREELGFTWRAVGAEHGFSESEVSSLIRLDSPRFELDTPAIRDTVERCIVEITHSRSYFFTRDVLRAVAEEWQHTGVAARDLVHSVTTCLRESLQVIDLGQESGYQRITTREMYALEEKLLTMLEGARERAAHPVRDVAVSAALRRRPTMSKEQEAALRHITGEQGAVSCLVGMAGTGKTFVLDAAREVWTASGFRVIGTALAGRAARQLEDCSGIKSDTLARTLWLLDRTSMDVLKHHAKGLWDAARLDMSLEARGFTEKGKRKVRRAFAKHAREFDSLAIDSKTVIVLDEAGMVGTRLLERLVSLVVKAGAKLVMVGDPDQLQPIEAGGPFRAIVKRFSAARLTTIERQYEEWMRDAVRQFATGDARAALSQYAMAERLFIADSRREAMSQLIEQWRRCRTSDLAETIILAGTREETRALNLAAQAARRETKELNEDRRTRLGDTALFEGDRVVFTTNSRKLGVHNGDFGTIVQIREPLIPWKTEFVIMLDRRTKHGLFSLPCTVSFSSREYSGIELGYAVTTHKAQGTTVERSFVLAGGWMQDRQQTYVQMSRAREQSWIFASTADAGADLTELVRQMKNSRHKQLAHDVHRQERAWSQAIQQ